MKRRAWLHVLHPTLGLHQGMKTLDGMAGIVHQLERDVLLYNDAQELDDELEFDLTEAQEKSVINQVAFVRVLALSVIERLAPMMADGNGLMAAAEQMLTEMNEYADYMEERAHGVVAMNEVDQVLGNDSDD